MNNTQDMPMTQKLLTNVRTAAENIYYKLAKQIHDFEAELNDSDEVGAYLVSFHSHTTFHITDIGYHGVDMIIFYGENEEGQKLKLVQHISQLNVLLAAVKKIDLNKPARRIGFIQGDEK